jgi:hypothetical protein
MFGRKSLAEQADDFIAILSAEQSEVEAAQQAAQRLVESAHGARVEQLNDVVSHLAPAVSTLGISRAALLAITCGALVEQGASAEPIAAAVVARFKQAVLLALPFVEACIAEGGDQAAEAAVKRFAPQVSERMPEEGRAFISLEWLSAATLAMLSRLKTVRKQVQADQQLTQAIGRFDQVGMELPCFREMLSILDDEQIVVLHPALGRGYAVRIAGIGNNFQLHTLVEDALIGDVEQGWLPGERPSPEVAALAKDAPITDPDSLPSAHGIFNLWNWTGLRPDGTLPNESQAAGKEHWIWNEGVPADIVRFAGTRIILIGPAPYPRGWGSGRFFPGMKGEFEVLRQLSTEEAYDWLDRIARAPKPVPAGHYITAADIAQAGL